MTFIPSGRCSRALIFYLLASIGFGLGCSSFQAARLYQSGSSELRRGEYPQAIADLERAAELAPHASEIQNHLGLALVGAGKEDEAELAFRRALDLDCDNAAAADNLEQLAVRRDATIGKAGSEVSPERDETR